MNTFSIDRLNYVNTIRTQMNEHKLMLCYKGVMTQDIVIALLNLTESKLNQVKSDSSIKLRVFGVMVECLQNITQHSEKSEHVRSNIFMIGYAERAYSIYSGNVIKSDKVVDLKKRMVTINTMDDNEMRKFYKYLIKNESLSKQTGFGLGLIQIARKTGNPLDFNFEKIDDDHHFFSLKTIVDH